MGMLRAMKKKQRNHYLAAMDNPVITEKNGLKRAFFQTNTGSELAITVESTGRKGGDCRHSGGRARVSIVEMNVCTLTLRELRLEGAQSEEEGGVWSERPEGLDGVSLAVCGDREMTALRDAFRFAAAALDRMIWD